MNHIAGNSKSDACIMALQLGWAFYRFLVLQTMTLNIQEQNCMRLRLCISLSGVKTSRFCYSFEVLGFRLKEIGKWIRAIYRVEKFV